MTIISLIAALDEAGGLGFNNQLLCHLPADLQHFKVITMHKPIIMGRKTFESIGKPLSDRLNIVLTRTKAAIDGVQVFDSLKDAYAKHQEYPEIIVIGGQELFNETINEATTLYITRIHHQFIADAFFPEIDEQLWYCKTKEFRLCDEKNKYNMTFYTYERNI